MIESRCGLKCSECDYRISANCGGCLAIDNPFWGECDIKTCNEAKNQSHCGQCREIPCDNLTTFAYDKEHGDSDGSRIKICRTWEASSAFDPTKFVQDIASQNAAALKEHFAPEAVIRWHDSNEEFTREEYIRANCEYPGSWQGKLQKIEKISMPGEAAKQEDIVMITKIFSKELTVLVTSFVKLQSGKITQLDEYFSTCGEPPQWRKDMKVGKPI